MPEMSPFGWFHTIMGIVALLSGGYSIIKYKIIESKNTSAKIFLSTTVITCLLYTSPSPRDATLSRMPSSA